MSTDDRLGQSYTRGKRLQAVNPAFLPTTMPPHRSIVEPVSQASYLNEKDRFYRAVETLENGGDLVDRSISRLLHIDERLRAAEADGASPMVLAMIERAEATFGQAAGTLANDFMNKPYERW